MEPIGDSQIGGSPDKFIDRLGQAMAAEDGYYNISYEEWLRKKDTEKRLRDRLVFEAKKEILEQI